jgi:molybdopterin/thiamine biosynthesis adenylyltransferase
MKVSTHVQRIRSKLTKAAMKKMATSNVLIVGMKGLGVEIGELVVFGISEYSSG